METTECPYCCKITKVNEDGQAYDLDILHQEQCNHCDRYFTFTTSVSFSYEAFKAPCLNGGKHKFNLSKSHPVRFSRMVCEYCEEQRLLTEEEMLEFKIDVKIREIDF
ncbi:hypothetical protein SAMN04515674_105279 [Pseudarcicella hirudinis]|uniref:Uncharacterized protein n=1 Tax=Pseudarcicella hirudinis TaxID=1079859 RepID=A0A1I5SYH9_9BACT|nr:hypothetical protein [Pseudarcicella hirudinis]SFP75829.1 hypothetical protein SAMN04515674_105279 [Pseudarcicella hirudinis]